MSVDEPTTDPTAVDGRPADRATDARTDDTDTADRAELAAQVELLAEENRRLRTEYARARRSQYRNTALGLAAVGIVAALGGLVFPDGREVLFALAATGLFGGVLTAALTPGQFVSAEVGERVYAATAANGAALVDELGLRDDRIYVPTEGDGAIRLFVPQRPEYEVPSDRTGPIVADERARGLLLETTGNRLFAEFERALTGDLASVPGPLATQLTDGLVEQFELARSATADVDDESGRVTVAVTDSAFGDVDRIDHPIASFLAVGFATGLERPIELDVVPADDRADWLVTCRWGLEGEGGENQNENENETELRDERSEDRSS